MLVSLQESQRINGAGKSFESESKFYMATKRLNSKTEGSVIAGLHWLWYLEVYINFNVQQNRVV